MSTPHPSDYKGPQPEQIHSMFQQVAANYDKANSILSLGIHHLWKKQLVRWSQASPGEKVLDCATGTGDLALLFKKAVGHNGDVIATDFCAEMMTTAPAKAQQLGLQIRFETADVTQLPYPDASFDIVSISFGIRNVNNPFQALQEMRRVLKPQGRLMILEFGPMKTPILSHVYNFYSERLLPKIGGWISGRPEAYEYLQKSSAKFPGGQDFLKWVQEAGFKVSEFKSLSFGIAYLYKAQK